MFGVRKAAREFVDCLHEVQRETERLKAENAKLRKELDHWHVEQVHAYGNWEDAYKYASKLEAENAKLQKLCEDIWNDACHFEGFWDYVHDDGTIYREDELPHYQERMRECGIEVK